MSFREGNISPSPRFPQNFQGPISLPKQTTIWGDLSRRVVVAINGPKFMCNTVDGSEIRRENQLSLVVIPLFTGFYTSKRWLALGFLNYQQYHPPTPGLQGLGLFHFLQPDWLHATTLHRWPWVAALYDLHSNHPPTKADRPASHPTFGGR